MGWLEELRPWLHPRAEGIRRLRDVKEPPYQRDSWLIDQTTHRHVYPKTLCSRCSRKRYPYLVFLHGFGQFPGANLLRWFIPNMFQERQCLSHVTQSYSTMHRLQTIPENLLYFGIHRAAPNDCQRPAKACIDS